MNKQKSDNSNIIQWIIPSILLVLFLIVTLFNYSANMKQRTEEEVINRLAIQTKEMNESYRTEIEAISNVARVSAGYLAEMDDLFSPEAQKVLYTIEKQTHAQDAIIVKTDGSFFDTAGYEATIFENISKNDLLSGKIYISDIFRYKNVIKYHIIIAAPIKSENKLLGSVAIMIPFDSLSDVTSSEEYSVKNTYGLVKADGTIVEKSGNISKYIEVGDNLFDQLESMIFVESTYNKLTQNIESAKSGNITFSTEVNANKVNTYHLIYEPVGDYGWSTITLSTDMQVQKTVSEEQKITSTMVTKIIVALLIFTTIAVMINVINKAKYVKESRELQDKAETDMLTDLLNKIATEKKIQYYMENEGKEKYSLMFVLDIDNFKKINDTMGHVFGDEVLSTLGRKIKSEFRINDIVGRTGGDEFVVFLKDLKDDNTMRKEALRVATFFKTFQVGEYVKYSATASIGAAIFPTDGNDFNSLYKAADQALYKAKRRGKNQLAFYNEEYEGIKEE